MRRIYLYFLLIFISIQVWGQSFSGQIFMKDDTQILLNHIYVTNLSTLKTVLSNYNGEFSIPAKEGDVIRFTSIISNRKDVKVSNEMLSAQKNFIELKYAYYEIPEVVIKFKPTGNLRADMAKLKNNDKSLQIAKIVGLPAPKGNGLPPATPLANLAGGGLSLSVDTLYDILSGEQKKKIRQQKYEKMISQTSAIRAYYGDDYFNKMKIPGQMIDNFLQFVYESDPIHRYVENNSMEAVKPYMEKYAPIYLKRLRASKLMEMVK